MESEVGEISAVHLPMVQAFWGGQIGTMERLSLASFVHNGHPVDVFAYEPLDAPSGVSVKDASEIIPRSKLYTDDRGSLSSFANMFRYKLLLERGGWWIDLDTVCLRPLDFEDEYIIATEPDGTVANDIFRVPAGSELMAYAYRRCLKLRWKRRKWGTFGPALLAEAVKATGLQRYEVHHDVFNPIDWPDWERFLDPEFSWIAPAGTYSVHLWNSMWGLNKRDKEAVYPSGCLYEQLKRRYLRASSKAPGAA